MKLVILSNRFIDIVLQKEKQILLMVPWGENCDKPLKLKILTLYKTRPIYLSIYYLSL